VRRNSNPGLGCVRPHPWRFDFAPVFANCGGVEAFELTTNYQRTADCAGSGSSVTTACSIGARHLNTIRPRAHVSRFRARLRRGAFKHAHARVEPSCELRSHELGEVAAQSSARSIAKLYVHKARIEPIRTPDRDALVDNRVQPAKRRGRRYLCRIA